MADIPKQVKEITLDLEGIPRDLQSEVKDAVGEHILNNVIDYLAEGKNPITGGKFKQLSKKYADKFHGGDRTARLKLSGDMQAALGWENTKNGIVFGIMDDDQVPKADQHNKLSGLEGTAPKRRFVPDENQNYTSKIMNGVYDIVDKYKEDIAAEKQVLEELKLQESRINVGTILSNESIAELLLQRLLK